MTAVHPKRKFVEYVVDVASVQIKATDATGKRVIEGIATTPSVDRMGDRVDPKGVQFMLPLPLLWGHSSGDQIGNVTWAEVTDDGIKFRAVVADEGTSIIIDKHWSELKAGLYQWVSIGFRSLKYAVTETGLDFTQWEWLELSCVAIPANPEAAITSVRSVKHFAVPDRALPESGPQARALSRPPGATATTRTAASTGHKTMKLADRITEKEQRVAELQSHARDLAESDLDDAQLDELNEVNAQLASERKALEVLQATEAQCGAKAAPIVITQSKTATDSTALHRRPRERKEQPGDWLVKSYAVSLLSFLTGRSAAQIYDERYKGHDGVAMILRAAVAPAQTTVAGWAAELVGEQVADFLNTLPAVSVYRSLKALSGAPQLTFDQRGKIKVPGRATSPNLAGDFVGEAQPIRVGRLATTAVTLLPHKMGIISEWSREMAQLSNPSIESLVRDAMQVDTAGVLDARLLDANAGNAIRPAGLLNGVTPTPSAGTTPANILADLKAVLAPLIAAKASKPVFLINPIRLLGLSTVQNATGQFIYRDEVAGGKILGFDFIASSNVPEDELIGVNAADFVTANGDTPEFLTSEVATIHEEDVQANVKPIVGGAAGTPEPAQPVRSLFQTATIATRMLLDVTWAMRREDMVSAVDGIAW